MTTSLQELKARIIDYIDEIGPRLIQISQTIHANPELGYEEEQASTWAAESLDAAGFSVDRGICGMSTAFRATFGSGPLHVGLCAEYDALPAIGHACGHNVIAASSVGAAMAGILAGSSMAYLYSLVANALEERPQHFSVDTLVMPAIIVLVAGAAVLGTLFSARRITKKKAIDILRMS